MNFEQDREMIRLRHELRRLLFDRRHAEAQAVLQRMEALVAADAEEAVVLRPELARWQTSLGTLADQRADH